MASPSETAGSSRRVNVAGTTSFCDNVAVTGGGFLLDLGGKTFVNSKLSSSDEVRPSGSEEEGDSMLRSHRRSQQRKEKQELGYDQRGLSKSELYFIFLLLSCHIANR